LGHLEDDIKDLTQLIERKQIEVEQARILLENEKAECSDLQVIDQKDDCISTPSEQYEFISFEYELDEEERELDRQLQNEQMKREHARLYWQDKIKRVDSLSQSLRENTERAKQGHSEIEKEIAELQLENDKLDQERNNRKHELEKLITFLKPQDTFDRQKSQYDGELAILRGAEEDLIQQLTELEIQEDIQRSEEQEFAVVKENLAQAKELIQVTEASNRQFMELHRLHLRFAQEQSNAFTRAIEVLCSPYLRFRPHRSSEKMSQSMH
jgi:chromosome segregation ATPase